MKAKKRSTVRRSRPGSPDSEQTRGDLDHVDLEVQDDLEPEPELEPEPDSTENLIEGAEPRELSIDLVDQQDPLPGVPVKVSSKDPLRAYLQEIAKIPLLSHEEEFQLVKELREKNDLTAAKKLVSANLRLVVRIAMEYRAAYGGLLDLIQEGNVGLMKAVSKFDPTKGAKLSYYAGWWIRSYILKYILDNFRLVKIGTTQAQKKLFYQLIREKERLEAQGIHAGPKLLADRLQVKEKEVLEMESRLTQRGAEMSLDTPVDDSGESRSAHRDLLADHRELQDESLEHHNLIEILAEHVQEFRATLKEKERSVFDERLFAQDPKTLQEVADQYGLTRERARQIETRVIEKLRDFYKGYFKNEDAP